VALDLQPFSFTLDPSSPQFEERMTRIYRLARVITHESVNGRVVVSGDVPRRLLARIDPAAG
jgi:hypothetical protein